MNNKTLNKRELNFQLKHVCCHIAIMLREALSKYKLTIEDFSKKSEIDLEELGDIYYAELDIDMVTIAKIKAAIVALNIDSIEIKRQKK